MKTILCRLIIGSVLVLAPMFAQTTSAAGSYRILGTLTFVRVFPPPERYPNEAAFNLRVRGTCFLRDQPGPQDHIDIFMTIRSGRLDGVFAQVNGLTFKNAYGTALAALLVGSTVQIDNLPNCG